MERVVITGMGCVSPYGYGWELLFKGLLGGGSCIQRMADWESYAGLRSPLAAPCEIRNEKDIPRQYRRAMSPMSIMVAQAADEAVMDGKLRRDELGDGRCGCVIGSTMGSAQVINDAFELILPDNDFSQLTSMMFFKCMSHTCSANLSQYLGLSGTVMASSAACASSLQAIGIGFDLIRLGRQDLLFCGGAEEIHPTVTGIFDLLYATSAGFNDCPDQTPRPFDARRDGLVCGEGAGILVLESLSRAKLRGVPIYGEIVGYHSNASGSHLSQSNQRAMIICMEEALCEAGLSPGEIDYVNAHATGTIQGDAEEAAAIAAVFADKVPVSSLKGHIGHTMGAAGVMETIATLGMMQHKLIIPGLNLDEPAADCRGIQHLTAPRESQVNTFLKNGFAFGGINASLVCRKFDE